MQTDRRRVMSLAEFAAIPSDDEYPLDDLYQVLIDENERIDNEVYEQPERLRELTTGQRMLIQLGTFDSQVKNGGITQFFWNCAESIFDVADGIEALGLVELQANYDRALESLVGQKDQWLALRAEWSRGRSNPHWETFQQTYELLDLGWFDKAYFDKHGYDDQRKWVRQSRGLNHGLLVKLVEYACQHPAEFITE